MDQNTQVLADVASSLLELTVKGTVSTVNKKIRASKEEKNIEKLRATYDELINELLLEREEAVRIAQTYKSELDRVVINDDDIKHLHFTVTKIIEIFNSYQTTNLNSSNGNGIVKANETNKALNQIKDLISVDTLKTMQLLGFNYKSAIGEPLTQLCADSISSLGKKKKK